MLPTLPYLHTSDRLAVTDSQTSIEQKSISAKANAVRFPKTTPNDFAIPPVMHIKIHQLAIPQTLYMMRKLTGGQDYSARARRATPRRPPAIDPTFLVAAPLKLDTDGLVLEPVPDGATGKIGEPVAAETDPDPGPEPAPFVVAEATVPVLTAAVPVAKPVDPTAGEDLI